eukprot:scaffold7173_cov179-Ochromonas_danica.AAC.4
MVDCLVSGKSAGGKKNFSHSLPFCLGCERPSGLFCVCGMYVFERTSHEESRRGRGAFHRARSYKILVQDPTANRVH